MLANDRERELLAAILENPDDVAQRLVFADLLLERGEPWGELIALQCRPSSDPERTTRIKELLRDWQRFAGKAAPFCDRKAFRRGFVDRVGMKIADFAKHGERVFAAHPVSELVIANDHWSPAQLGKLAATPALRRVRRLLMFHKPGAKKTDPLGALGASPHLERLEELSLQGCGHSPADWSQLFAMTAPALRAVRLFGRTSVDIYAAIADNASLAELREIEEYRTWSVDADPSAGADKLAAAFARLAQHSRLQRLTIGGNHDVTLAALRPLFESSATAAVRHLDVSSNMPSFVRELASVLVTSAKLGLLRSLALNATDADTPVAPDEIAPLVATSSLHELRVWSPAWDEAAHARFVDLLLALPAEHPLAAVAVSHLHDTSRLAQRFRIIRADERLGDLSPRATDSTAEP